MEEFTELQKFVVQVKPPHSNEFMDLFNNNTFNTLEECLAVLNNVKNIYPQEYTFRALKIKCTFEVVA